MRFNSYLNEDNDIYLLIDHMVFTQDFESLDEAEGGLKDKLNVALGTLGLHAHGSGKGIIQTLLKAGKNVAQLFWYAMKAVKGDAEAKKKVKEIANKEITKHDVVDFLLRLDTMSMHLLTGPIHMIDALTGWHIGVDFKEKAENVADRIKKAIENLKAVVSDLSKPIANKIQQYISGLNKTLSAGAI
jgi:hypothetical protein